MRTTPAPTDDFTSIYRNLTDPILANAPLVPSKVNLKRNQFSRHKTWLNESAPSGALGVIFGSPYPEIITTIFIKGRVALRPRFHIGLGFIILRQVGKLAVVFIFQSISFLNNPVHASILGVFIPPSVFAKR